MGELRRSSGTRAQRLLNQHLIGRSPECALRLTGKMVSSQHALIRWSGRGWEILDRASLNGTRVNGQLLEAGRPFPLTKGATITFGHSDESWVMGDASEPEVMALALDDGTVLPGVHGVIGIPSGENPACTLYRDLGGDWKIESVDGSVRAIADGETISTGGRDFRVCLPSVVEATSASEPTRDSEAPSLLFRVSLDEDFVELRLASGKRVVSLGSRAHNYLLLTLARRQLADAEAGFPPTSCGWIEKDELAEALRINPEQVDGEVFRIRKHFARHELKEAAIIIERRARTKQIRLGIRDVHVERC
jgi:hypothetical protein